MLRKFNRMVRRIVKRRMDARRHAEAVHMAKHGLDDFQEGYAL